MKTKTLYTVVVYNKHRNDVLHFDFLPSSKEVFDACELKLPGENITSTTFDHHIMESVMFCKQPDIIIPQQHKDQS